MWVQFVEKPSTTHIPRKGEKGGNGVYGYVHNILFFYGVAPEGDRGKCEHDVYIKDRKRRTRAKRRTYSTVVIHPTDAGRSAGRSFHGERSRKGLSPLFRNATWNTRVGEARLRIAGTPGTIESLPRSNPLFLDLQLNDCTLRIVSPFIFVYRLFKKRCQILCVMRDDYFWQKCKCFVPDKNSSAVKNFQS